MRATMLIGLMASLVGLWASASHAQSNPGTTWGDGGLSPTRSYLGLNIGKSQFDPDCVANLTCDNGKTAFKLTAGSITTDVLGAEVSYLNMGKIGYAGGSQKASGLNLSLVGNLPVSAAFTAFGKIGATYGWTDTSTSRPGIRTGTERGFGLSYGLGLGYRLTTQWEVTAEYERHRFDFAPGEQTLGLTSVGLRYRY